MNSIIARDRKDRCYICGRWGRMEEHHLMHGTANRRNAEHYGLKVHLCHLCHKELHDHRMHDLELEQVAQRTFEFGKNYL